MQRSSFTYYISYIVCYETCIFNKKEEENFKALTDFPSKCNTTGLESWKEKIVARP